MADRGDTHYYVPKLNFWFAGSSLLFLVSVFWMVIDDWNAEWKTIQKQFRVIEISRAHAEMESPDSLAVVAREVELQAELERVLASYESKAGVIAEAEEAVFQAKGKKWKLTEDAKASKENFNWEKGVIEHHRLEHKDPAFGEADLRELMADLSAANLLKEEAILEFMARESELEALLAEKVAAQVAVKDAGKSLDLVRTKLSKIDPEEVDVQIANFLRDAPGIDFVGPSLTVKKYVLEDLITELNFTTKSRIDMCTTCHLAADQSGYDGDELANPFKSHPKLDLFLTAKSPHPVSKVGCTICHRGAGEALSFQHADHYPSDDEEMAKWKDGDLHWHKQHHWDYPMLSTEHIEASCIQCHKTSMELIAEEAPKVTEGYRMIERFGCYACHKIDWFPTKRKPGPSLKNLLAKMEPDFIDSWIAEPKAFRPTTWMPQIFHLENFAADMVIATEPMVDDQGMAKMDADGQPLLREFTGQEWNDNAIASISAFLRDRAPKQALPAIPVEGDSERGREVMRLAGCYACHNVAPYDGADPLTNDPVMEAGRYNEHGPNLRGVATKINAEWLFNWVKNPHEMWSETVMPDLRLEDQDAADITAYMMEDPDGIFTDVPDGWEPKAAPYDLAVLQEQAREFFSRDGTRVLADRFAGNDESMRWDQVDVLLVAVGEKFVMNQGCFSCHDIAGLEAAMPIGTELSTWASKTVDKLSWESMINILEEKHGWTIGERQEFSHYRENWLAQKLDAPRSFDRQKVKSPLERLKMPHFDFTEKQISDLSTFMVGLVEDEVQRAKMMPSADQIASDTGLRAIRQKNCVACHVTDPGTVTFVDEDGVKRKVFAELLKFGEDEKLPPNAKTMDEYKDAIARFEDYEEEELEEVGFRLLEMSPDVGISGESIFVEKDKLTEFTPPVGGDFVSVVTDYYFNGIEMYDAEAEDENDAYYGWNFGEDGGVEDVDGTARVYYDEPYDKVRWTFAPPVLLEEGHKLQREWFFSFLKDPVSLRQQIRTKMPTFTYSEGEAEGIADYFANRAAENWPSKYARTMRVALGLDLNKEFDGRPWPAISNFRAGGTGLSVAEVAEGAGVTPKIVKAIEAGAKVETGANFHKVLAFGNSRGFSMSGAVDPNYESVMRRSPSNLAARHAFIGTGQELAADAVNCYQCHFHGGEDPEQADAPIAWAPDLTYTRERLREGWLADWLANPNLIYPGTAMPGNFGADPPQYQETYPESSNAQQIEAVLDFLYNFDRAPTPSD